MAFYGNVDAAASLAGANVEAADITVAMQTIINDYIDAEINKDGFEENSAQVDYYDINRRKQSWLILKHMPVISITEVIDDQRNDPSTTIPSDSYVVDEEAAILQLDSVHSSDSGNARDYFTKGKQSVKVIYNYGYETVPTIIQSLANMLAAMWGEYNYENTVSSGLKSVQIGDYRKSFDTMLKTVTNKYDITLPGLFNRAKAIYQRGV